MPEQAKSIEEIVTKIEKTLIEQFEAVDFDKPVDMETQKAIYKKELLRVLSDALASD